MQRLPVAELSTLKCAEVCKCLAPPSWLTGPCLSDNGRRRNPGSKLTMGSMLSIPMHTYRNLWRKGALGTQDV